MYDNKKSGRNLATVWPRGRDSVPSIKTFNSCHYFWNFEHGKFWKLLLYILIQEASKDILIEFCLHYPSYLIKMLIQMWSNVIYDRKENYIIEWNNGMTDSSFILILNQQSRLWCCIDFIAFTILYVNVCNCYVWFWVTFQN